MSMLVSTILAGITGPKYPMFTDDMTPEERQAEHERLLEAFGPEHLDIYYRSEAARKDRVTAPKPILDEEDPKLRAEKIARWEVRHEEGRNQEEREKGEHGKAPVIDLGEYGHKPRWVVVPAPPELQMKRQDDIIVQDPVGSLSAENSPSSSSLKMATLVWEFQAGPEEGWDGLTEEELQEYAYKFLECAIQSPSFRDAFRGHISDSSIGHLVEDVEDSLPPLPVSPGTDLLGEVEFLGPFWPRNESPEPVDAKSKSPMLHRMQGFDGACDLLPLPAGPFHLEDPKVTADARQTFDMPGYGLPGGLPAADPTKLFRQHAKTKVTKPRAMLPDTGHRQYATKSVDARNLPAANNQGTDDDSDEDDDNPKPESFKFAEANRRRLKDRSFRDKVMPKRTFRRMRPWAGARISKEYINEDDLSRLSRFPSTDRAFLPRIGLKTPAGKVTKKVTMKPESSSRTVTPSRVTAAPAATAVRRNPRRTARNK